MMTSRMIAFLCVVAGTVGLCGEPATPGDAKKAAVDAFGDPLPAGALARLGTLRFQHGAAVRVLRYSRDGKVLASLGAETPVGKFLAKRGPGMHHVAYQVDDVAEALGELEAKGAELIDERPRRGLFGLEVAFVHPDAVHGVLAEIVSVG